MNEKVKDAALSKMDLEQKNKALDGYGQAKKNPKIALILSIFLGFLGVDRFYLNHKIYGGIKLGLLAIPIVFYATALGLNHLLIQFADISTVITFFLVSSSGYLILYPLIVKYLIPLLWIIDIFLIKKATRVYNKEIKKTRIKGGGSVSIM